MHPRINVSFLPELFKPQRLGEVTTVVIDVLRASTTIITALARGAAEVIPCVDVDEARRMAARRSTTLLGGERNGMQIDGFHVGNSPAEYTEDRIKGRSIVMSTTNGTRALHCCRESKQILLGAFVNLTAVCERVREAAVVELLCAGTDGRVSREDVLFAGAAVDRLCKLPDNISLEVDDQAAIAAAVWREAESQFAAGNSLAESLKNSQGGRNLAAIGFDHDIEFAAEIDRFTVVPEFDPRAGTIQVRP